MLFYAFLYIWFFIVHELLKFYGRCQVLTCESSSLSPCIIYSVIEICFFVSPEFGAEEYKALKVDPISQFSVPVMVWRFLLLLVFYLYTQFFYNSNNFVAPMNKDDVEDTKEIVQHSTSMKVNIVIFISISARENSSLLFYLWEML